MSDTTPEQMADALRAAGWKVFPPVDQKKCTHPHRQGFGWVSADGSSGGDWHCPDCGASDAYSSPPSQRVPT